jgi:hypothetical protein
MKCEVAACGGRGARPVKKPWIARFRVSGRHQSWLACEHCADLVGRDHVKQGLAFQKEWLEDSVADGEVAPVEEMNDGAV